MYVTERRSHHYLSPKLLQYFPNRSPCTHSPTVSSQQAAKFSLIKSKLDHATPLLQPLTDFPFYSVSESLLWPSRACVLVHVTPGNLVPITASFTHPLNPLASNFFTKPACSTSRSLQPLFSLDHTFPCSGEDPHSHFPNFFSYFLK